MPKEVSAAEAVGSIQDGSTLTFCGSAGVGVPASLFAALAERHAATDHPRDLTLYFPVEAGTRAGEAMDLLARPGMLRRLIGGAFIFTGSTGLAETVRLIVSNGVEAYNLPMGCMFQLLRDIAAGRPGLLTEVGIGTFVDPQRGGGKLNSLTTEDLVVRVEVCGRELLFYRSFPIDTAWIRATVADEDGNLAVPDEASRLGCLAQAMAARGSGGKVVAQVRTIVRRGSIPAKEVDVPGFLVDHLVLDPAQEQLMGTPFSEAAAGRRRTAEPPPNLEDAPVAARVVARRASRELPDGALVNVGFGMGSLVPRVIAAEGREAAVTFMVEQGAIGGVPLSGAAFGVAQNPSSFMEMPSWFDFIDGGQFSATCLGLGEIDREGNVNNHWIGDVLTGCGGFINITARAPHVIFCGTLTSGGLRVEVGGGRLKVLQEGRHRKFVPRVDRLTFNGRRARQTGQRVTVVTERAVFELEEPGLTLTEIAPGVTVKQVAACLGFDPLVRPRLATMPEELFQ